MFDALLMPIADSNLCSVFGFHWVTLLWGHCSICWKTFSFSPHDAGHPVPEVQGPIALEKKPMSHDYVKQ